MFCHVCDARFKIIRHRTQVAKKFEGCQTDRSREDLVRNLGVIFFDHAIINLSCEINGICGSPLKLMKTPKTNLGGFFSGKIQNYEYSIIVIFVRNTGQNIHKTETPYPSSLYLFFSKSNCNYIHSIVIKETKRKDMGFVAEANFFVFLRVILVHLYNPNQPDIDINGQKKEVKWKISIIKNTIP